MDGDDSQVRQALMFLSLLGAALLAVVLLLPVLGILFLLVAAGVGLLLAVPLLAKLPWFRDRIFVRREGNFRGVRFGRDDFTPHRKENPAGKPDEGDVIDVEGRELPDNKE